MEDMELDFTNFVVLKYLIIAIDLGAECTCRSSYLIRFNRTKHRQVRLNW